jgi:hypothetical protein
MWELIFLSKDQGQRRNDSPKWHEPRYQDNEGETEITLLSSETGRNKKCLPLENGTCKERYIADVR